MRHLDILRHAKTEPDHEDGDHERRLTPRGRRDAAAVGIAIAQRGDGPGLILCSTARRAVETLEQLVPSLTSTPKVLFEAGLYLARPDGLMRRLAKLEAGEGAVMLIGHNPGLHELALTLIGAAGRRSRLAEKFPTACLVRFRSERTSWTEAMRGGWSLVDDFRPSDLQSASDG